MALKITTQIGTDKGITSEAYIRIADYQISKYGSANFRIEIYQSQADLTPAIGAGYPGAYSGVARNQQIGESLYVPMTKEVTETITVKRMVPVETTEEVSVPAAEEGGEPTTQTVTRHSMEEQDVEQEVTKTVPDMSGAEEIDIFAFGYGKLKAKLDDIFGAEHVIDC